MRLANKIHRFRSERQGVVAVEYAFIIPFLLILVSGIVDLGFALSQSSSLSNAARAGAQYAMRFPSDTAGIKQVVEQSVSFDPALLTIESKLTCECPDGSPTACNDVCAGGAPNSFVSVSVSKTYSSPLPTALVLGISSLSGSAVMRAN
jgi:Flp pilus assembly pilin Flp